MWLTSAVFTAGIAALKKERMKPATLPLALSS
jgi:hypothetical protein